MNQVFDYIVVGAGSAGCVLANRLTADGRHRVLLLEAGPPDKKTEIRVPAAWPSLFKSEVDWAFTSEPEKELGNRRVFLPRGRTLGGSSSTNAMMYIRGHRSDFDDWAAAGNGEWSYENLLPYFRRSENNQRGADRFHGDQGELYVTDLATPNPLTKAFVTAAEQTGIPANPDFNGQELDGVGITQVTQHRGRRWSTADAFLRPARRRGNLTVTTGALVERVLLDGRTATGVEYRVDGTRLQARAKCEVILSAGTYGTPHLLLLSGIGPADQLTAAGVGIRHHLPGVGQGLIDHFVAPGLAARTDRAVSLYSAKAKRHLISWLLLRRGMLVSNAAEAAGFIRTRPDLEAPDLELLFAPVLFLAEGLEPPPGHGYTIGVIVLHPRSRGQVSITRPDPMVPPAITNNYLSDPKDLEVAVTGVKLAQRVAAQSPLHALTTNVLLPAPDANDDDIATLVRERGHTMYHPVGTTRMGTDTLAVVNPSSLDVHGISGLRVIDASVMPNLVRGHTNAATIMIAERGADLIMGRSTDRTAIRAIADDPT